MKLPILVAAMVAVVSLPPVLSQNISEADLDNAVCRAPKPSVGSARVYLFGANSWHIPVLDYLTEVVGQEFDPPISFTRASANLYLKNDTVEGSLGMGFDFMLANPYQSQCYESEGQAVSLATQIFKREDPRTGKLVNLTQYGATLYTLTERADIKTLKDVKGKIVGTNKITSLAT